ncbi:flagellar protein FlaG [Paenibacillus sp. PastF-3]|jgi:flagellar protein FlaG|uniref:flagellar protein FlaG n=1 Tax=Paenibacillus sp. PastF-3 TaxID=2940626 RepID=UPI0024768C7F|nr:flagellar protein FlaG [Paenibacillus sp. PastF-3]MDH6371043.1 flagellar protein FlaG [Paenibacillus sp. PastF-3]
MNVQFSFSASSMSVGQSRHEVTSGAEPEKVQSNPVIIRDAKDISLKEKQGDNITVAEEQLIRTIERAVKSLQGPQTALAISIHEKTHDIIVKVLNKETGELIREVPPEKTLDLVAKMMEIAGILVDEKI